MPKALPALLLAGLIATAAGAAPPAEWVGQAALPGLVIGHRLSNGQSMIVERVPPGETVERWTRMVTNQRFAGQLAGGTLDRWLPNYLGGIEQGCPGFRPGASTRLRIEGRPALDIRVDCPRNPATGQPETFFLRAIASGATLHLAQVAFRHVPSAEETRWAQTHLASVTLCTRASRSPACRAGPEPFDR
ncbi:MAG TPA: hypothetical protein VLK25_11750 [Allosphingosinicella sp.]|nr:hypothetical protein [Allosphingosinicella sp.]